MILPGRDHKPSHEDAHEEDGREVLRGLVPALPASLDPQWIDKWDIETKQGVATISDPRQTRGTARRPR